MGRREEDGWARGENLMVKVSCAFEPVCDARAEARKTDVESLADVFYRGSYLSVLASVTDLASCL